MLIQSLSLFPVSNVYHGFCTKHHAILSEKAYLEESSPGSSEAKVTHNAHHEALYTSLSSISREVIFCHQTHSNIPLWIESSTDRSNLYGDAMVTNLRGTTLALRTADCAPILLSNRDGRHVAAIHAGWKGTLSGIIERTVELMDEKGSPPHQLIGTIGPMIQGDDYTVGRALKDRYIADNKDAQGFFKPIPGEDLFVFDLVGYCQYKLECLGIMKCDMIPISTYQYEQLFYSYRKTSKQHDPTPWRQVSFIGIRL